MPILLRPGGKVKRRSRESAEWIYGQGFRPDPTPNGASYNWKHKDTGEAYIGGEHAGGRKVGARHWIGSAYEKGVGRYTAGNVDSGAWERWKDPNVPVETKKDDKSKKKDDGGSALQRGLSVFSRILDLVTTPVVTTTTEPAKTTAAGKKKTTDGVDGTKTETDNKTGKPATKKDDKKKTAVAADDDSTTSAKIVTYPNLNPDMSLIDSPSRELAEGVEKSFYWPEFVFGEEPGSYVPENTEENLLTQSTIGVLYETAFDIGIFLGDLFGSMGLDYPEIWQGAAWREVAARNRYAKGKNFMGYWEDQEDIDQYNKERAEFRKKWGISDEEPAK